MVLRFHPSIVPKLLDWYYNNSRNLPWRINTTPYKILISEFMLQQTRVNTVIPYYQRFIKVLPDIKSLAECDEVILLKLWEGLGYYNRVRNLQKTAHIIHSEYNGIIPNNFETLLRLPGFGKYTAGAVSSIAYNYRIPAIDGNVIRVVTRLFNLQENIADSSVQKKIYTAIMEILPENDAGKFNQAIMELGSLICLPRQNSLCDKCPLKEYCESLKNGTSSQLPVKVKTKPRKTEPHTLLLIVHNNSVLLHQRDSTGLLAKMWEYINYTAFLEPDDVQKKLNALGFKKCNIHSLHSAKHVFSHLEWDMKAYYVKTNNKPENLLGNYQWTTYDEIQNKYSLSSAFKPFTKQLATFIG